MNDRTSDLESPLALTWKEIGLWLLGRRRRIRVTGSSMQPTLTSGQVVLVDTRAYRNGLPKPGDIVVARHPYQSRLLVIKRVGPGAERQRVELLSDNSMEGTDSRQFGPVGSDRLVGRVTSVLR